VPVRLPEGPSGQGKENDKQGRHVEDPYLS